MALLHSHTLFAHSMRAPHALWDMPSAQVVEALATEVVSRAGWGDIFLDDKRNLRWNRIVAAGHSQGAGHAAFWAIVRNMRAVLLSGPQDCDECVTWLSRGANESPRRVAVYHRNEECAGLPGAAAKSFSQLGLIPRNLRRMGLRKVCAWKNGVGMEEECDGIEVDFKPVCREGRSMHSSVGTNRCAPLEMEMVWGWMFRQVRPGLSPVHAVKGAGLGREMTMIVKKGAAAMDELNHDQKWGEWNDLLVFAMIAAPLWVLLLKKVLRGAAVGWNIAFYSRNSMS